MPQLSPMNWFVLFMFFNFVFYLLILKNFFFTEKIIEINVKDKTNKNYLFML